jgi:hypothetical protein
VYSLRLCLIENSLIFAAMISLCTGIPPGELTTTANAAAREVDILLSRSPTF